MAELPSDGRTSATAGIRPQVTPTRVRALLSRAGEIAPVYRATPGDSDGPLNEPVTDSTADGWTDTWYSSPGTGSGNEDPELDSDLTDEGTSTDVDPQETEHETWAYLGDVLCARVYPSENEETSGGAGVSQSDEPEFIVPAQADVRRGDRLRYDGMVYELENPTDRDAFVRWTAAPDIG